MLYYLEHFSLCYAFFRTLPLGMLLCMHLKIKEEIGFDGFWACHSSWLSNCIFQGKSCWYPLYKHFERKSIFCIIKAHQAREVYGLFNCWVVAQTLIEMYFIDTNWLISFEDMPRWSNKVECRALKVDLWPKSYTLSAFMYQEPPRN